MTSLPLRQAPSGDQLAAIAYFLDELEHKTPIKALQKETDGNSALLDTINSLVSVVRVNQLPVSFALTGACQGAFIAGVQASLIGITSTSNKTALRRATNWFAFVGLTLDLIGTSAGVARALLLQASIRRTHRLVSRLNSQIDGARHQVRQLQERGLGLSADPRARKFLSGSVHTISRVVLLLAEDGRFAVQSAEELSELQAARLAALDALDSDSLTGKRKHHFFRGRWLSNVILPHIHVEGLGHIPVASLAGGTMCLLITVVLYAATSQPHGVWISCAAIFAVMLTGSLVPDTDPHSKLIPVQTPVP